MLLESRILPLLAERLMWNSAGLELQGNVSHFNKLKHFFKSQGQYIHVPKKKQLNLHHKTHVVVKQDVISFPARWPSESPKQEMSRRRRCVNDVLSIQKIIVIWNMKQSPFSLSVFLHSVIMSSGGGVPRFARHFTIMSLNRERSLMLC